jgi:hypothetical protein
MIRNNWTLIVVVGIFILLALILAGGLLGAPRYGGWGYGGWGMIGPWMMGGMFFMWLIPVGFVALTVLGITWFVRTVGGGNNSAGTPRSCPSCGRAVQADWRNCANCGTALSK